MTGGYRHDLDGLRGLAIALVVAFHVFDGRVSGGVDVFLLLSGFFFLGSQIRNADRPEQSINPWWSLWRTARRLLPSLILVLAATTVAVLALAPGLRNGETASQLTASLLYFQNVELAEQGADYAAASNQVSPLQHLWSMSVQGQFYLLGILIVSAVGFVVRRIAATGRRAPSTAAVMLPILVAATAASFWWALVLHAEDQALNYYSTATRMWELTLGALLALFVARTRARLSARTDRTRLPSALSSAVALIGVAMIVSTGFFLDGADSFPGPWALWPLGGAALVILAGGSGAVSRFLGSGPMRWLGDVAYSLYLWHWPLLIIAMSALDLSEPNVGIGVAVIALSLGLAWATHALVEKPLMQRGKRPRRDARPVRSALRSLKAPAARGRAFGGVVLAAAAVTMLLAGQEHANRLAAASEWSLDPVAYPGARALYDGAHVPEDVDPAPSADLIGEIYPKIGDEGCMTYTGEPGDVFRDVRLGGPREGEPCVYGDPDGAKTMYLIGSSHSEQWGNLLDRIARDNGWRLIPFIRQGCVVTTGPDADTSDPDCAEWSDRLLDRIAAEQPDLVISNSTRPGGGWGEGVDEVSPGAAAAMRAIDRAGVPFVGIRDNPWHLDGPADQRNIPACLASGGTPEECGTRRSEALAPVDPAARLLESFDRAWSIDLNDFICDGGHCPAVVGNIIVYRDSNHLSVAYADTLQPMLALELEPILRELERD
ncbi:acyltransferase family protein [Corynebacterium xerosis]|uniref:acyltransferase family protein n=1 Tax=Corynebacterium xerosis TaxID=1725 RepID=UPI001C641002|nr:acyltransferase family protein [Corynebacterium xerosis]